MAKFLITSHESEPVNSQFSGIFKKALDTQENIDYEFLTPKTKKASTSQSEELNLKEYFGKFMEPQSLQNTSLQNVLRKISRNFHDGQITFKTNATNNLTVIHYNTAQRQAVNYLVLEPSSLGLLAGQTKIDEKPPIIKRKVGRPKNNEKLIKSNNSNLEENPIQHHRTKFGRILKLTPVASKVFKLNETDFLSSKASVSGSLQDLPVEQVPTIVQQPEIPNLFSGLKEPPKKIRKISSQFRCASCRKVYLGKNKMTQHYKNFPSHRLQLCENESNLFSHLMTLVRQRRSNKDMADTFFKEIENFVQICEKLTPKLITNQDNPNTHHHLIDKNAANLLRINPGNYRINMNVFDKDFKFDNPIEAIQSCDNETEEILDQHELDSQVVTEDQKSITSPKKPLIIIDDVPSLECSSLLISIERQTNELTSLTNISLETEDF